MNRRLKKLYRKLKEKVRLGESLTEIEQYTINKVRLDLNNKQIVETTK